MKTNHTPGPWIIDQATDLGLAVIEDTEEGFAICEIAPQEGYQAQANAALIARAPELLADNDRLREINAELVVVLNEQSALFKEFLSRSGRAKSFAVWSGDVQRALKAAKAVLAKAKEQS